jgi:hypothetical protein
LRTAGSVVGSSELHPANIILDITPNPDGGTRISKNGFGHPTCINPPCNAAALGLSGRRLIAGFTRGPVRFQ